MPEISRELLQGYLDDALDEEETAQVEKALRDSEALRRHLRLVMQERDRGEHSLGAIWRRERITCPSREQLGSYLLQALPRVHQCLVGVILQAQQAIILEHTLCQQGSNRIWTDGDGECAGRLFLQVVRLVEHDHISFG